MNAIRRRSPRRSSIWPRLALAGCSVLFCLLLGELAVRVLDVGPDISAVSHDNFRLSDNAVLRYELAPLSPDGAGVISSAGLRDREYPEAKPPGTVRIAVLGDSIAFGHGVEASQSLAKALERRLQSHDGDGGLRFEVLNFGVTGYNVRQIVETLRSRALRYAPDVVLYVYCLNDPQDYSIEMARLQAAARASRRVYDFVPLHRSRLFNLTRYAILRPRWQEDDPQFAALGRNDHARYYAQLHTGASWDAARAELDALRDLAAAHEIPVLVLLVPILDDLEDDPLAAVHQKLAAELGARGLETLDLRAAYATYERTEEQPVGWDALHPTARGHDYTAVVTLLHLLDAGLVPGLTTEDAGRLLEADGDGAHFAQLARRARQEGLEAAAVEP